MDWESLMLARQAAIDAIDTDLDIVRFGDEIMPSYNAGETLSAAIERADAPGLMLSTSMICFLPIEMDYVPDREGPVAAAYYSLRTRDRANAARKKRLQVSHVEHAAVLSGESIRLSRYRCLATTCS